MQPVLTKKEAELILKLGEGEIEVSLDLGRSKAKVRVKEGIAELEGVKIPVSAFSKVKEEACYIADSGELKKLAFFSDETNLYYKLVPTNDWPTITLSSTPMHRHTKISPRLDTMSKINEIKPVVGKVLDTCCGLGYTAIVAAAEADEVCTFERDNNMLHMAGFNPYSIELFANPKIKVFREDILAGIKQFKDSFFDRIIHDPPTFKYSPYLYSAEFYRELYRVMKPKGRLYHYAPWPQKTHNRVFYKGIIRRLAECGFRNAVYSEKSSGVAAIK